MVNYKKALALMLALIMAFCLASCTKQGTDEGERTTNPEEMSYADDDPDAVRTGLGIICDVRMSEDVEDTSRRDVVSTVAAVTTDYEGRIISAEIDELRLELNAKNGLELTDVKTVGEGDGERREKVDAFEEYISGMNSGEIDALIDYLSGQPVDEKLKAVCNMDLGNIVKAVRQAIGESHARGAESKDELKLLMSAYKSDDGSDDNVIYVIDYAALTLNNKGEITSSSLDESECGLTLSGNEFADYPGAYRTNKSLGEQYGLKKNSSIHREWDEQIAAYESYITGKKPAELSDGYDSDGITTDEELRELCTLDLRHIAENISKAG